MRSIRKHLTYANVMATLGVFLALGGSAVAITAGKNTVKSKSIAKGAVKTSDIANGAVSKAKLKADAVSSNAIADGSIGAKQLSNVVVRTADAPLNDGAVAIPLAQCKPGERAIGGGGRTGTSGPDITVEAAYPVESAAGAVPNDGESFIGWQVWFRNAIGTNGNATATAYAVCVQ